MTRYVEWSGRDVDAPKVLANAKPLDHGEIEHIRRLLGFDKPRRRRPTDTKDGES